MYSNDLEKRFVEIAIEKSFVTSLQVFKALKIQEKESFEGRQHKDIAAIMVEQGEMNTSQINEVLFEMDIPAI